jgi:malate permease and related proteins
VLDTLSRLLPVLVGMAVGFGLRRLRVAGHHDGDFVFKIVFYVCLPALMFTSLATVTVTERLVVFMLAAPAIVAAGYVAGRIVARRRPFTGVQVPVLVTAAMVVNSGFALPFIQALHGAAGVARVAVFDGINSTLTFTWAYYTAARGNPQHEGGSLLLGRVLRSPPLYGIAAGLGANLAGWQPPEFLLGVTRPFAAAVPVLISLGIGILFEPAGGELRRAGVVVLTRLVSALTVGVLVILAFDLDEMDRTILLLLCVAPVAFVTVTFASLENLDVRLATSALSLSLATSLILSLVIALLSS